MITILIERLGRWKSMVFLKAIVVIMVVINASRHFDDTQLDDSMII